MRDGLVSEMQKLQAKKVYCSPPETEPWGTKTTLRLPSGGEIGLYQPSHPVALHLRSK